MGLKFRAFFFFSRHIFLSFLPLSGCLLVEFRAHGWALGLSCETQTTTIVFANVLLISEFYYLFFCSFFLLIFGHFF